MRLLTFVFVLFAGCVAVRTRLVDTLAAVREVRDNIVASDRLSFESVKLLRMIGVTEQDAVFGRAQIDPDAQVLEPVIKRYYLHSELALAKALKKHHKDDNAAAGQYLAAAHYALKGMLEPDCEAPISLMCDHLKLFYGRALIGLVEYLSRRDWKDETQVFRHASGKRYVLTLTRDTEFENPRNYDTIRPSAQIGIKGLANRHIRYGIGLSLTACRKKNMIDPQDLFLPLVGTCLPITVVLQFHRETNSEVDARLEFYNAFRTESVMVNGRQLALAGNFSAPFASLIEKTRMSGLTGFLAAFGGSEEFLRKAGFYSVEPYHTEKIPLITVHGLFSSPLTWVSVHNDLMGDDVVRRNYEIWHYLYPTNLPILENARTFREKLDALEAYIAVKEGASRRGMVIIAHSMGGLLAKTTVAADGATVEKLLFDPSAVAETLDSEVKADIDAYMHFMRKPYVERVIFIAVPHRGSNIADNWIGLLGRRLISLPEEIAKDVTGTVTQISALLRPELRGTLDADDISSIRGLSPANPVIEALSKVPVAQDVPFHSIIGDRGKGGGVNSSDGVVPYVSSHLDGAKSELVVPAEHSAHLHPLAVHEIRRILHLHLTESAKAEGPSGLSP